MALKELSDGGPNGTRLGQSASDLVGFHGETPVAQAVCTLSAALTAGETTPADVAAAVVEMYAALSTKGILG